MRPSFIKTANRIVMVVAGFVLIVATVLKIHHLLTEPIISEGFWESWQFFVIQIPLELGLGIWLVSGLFRKAAWLAGVLAFGLFIVVTLQKGLVGAESCGCFGRVHVNPWITLSAIDIPLFVVFLIFRPKGQKLLPPPWPSTKHFFGVAVPSLAAMSVIVLVLLFNKPPEKTDKYEVVRPEQWLREGAGEEQVDKEWSMLRHIDIADSLRTSIAVVVFYNTECESCYEAIPLYDRMSRDMADDSSIRFALVEIPPYDTQQNNIVPADTACLRGKLDSSKEWYIKTPLVVVLHDGVVVKSWEAETPALEEILEAVFSVDRQISFSGTL